MVYVPDLQIFKYHGGPFDPESWKVPLKAVGWLEHPQTFAVGTVVASVVPKLELIVKQTRSAFSQYNFRGVKFCSFCVEAGITGPGPIWSQENIFIPGVDEIYLAPGGIVHYVETHSYLPPAEFVEGVLRCPDCQSAEYREVLRTTNRGVAPPLETRDEFRNRVRGRRM